ncbi:MAG: hypothetical protein H0T85_01690, partial [Geodermatophilaceae bacterium]|nr:hypothetical protein [Geodermatophilaceae bacterium]
MGSGILLAVLVVLWIVVLVPMVLRRGDEAGQSDEGTHTTMRVLHRRGSESHGVTAEAMDRLRRPLRDPRVEADVVSRRRRTLVGLIGLALLWAVLALFVASYFWTAQIVLDLMVFGYLAYLRLEAQREAERRARRKVRFPDRPVAPRAPMPGSGGTRPPTFSNADVTGPLPAVPAQAAPVAEGWTPN